MRLTSFQKKKDERESLFSPSDLLRLQTEQHAHDLRNHFDIISRHKNDRLKHYGLHFGKYVGRLARSGETKPVERTLTDTLLVCLSAANTLHQNLSEPQDVSLIETDQNHLLFFADAMGRFADACEKIDHMEEFVSMAKKANRDIIYLVMRIASKRGFDLGAAVKMRRRELAARQFYIQE
jgi:hypothetical protein